MGLWLYPWVESRKSTWSCRCVVRCQMRFEFSSWLKSHTTRARVLRQIAVQWQPGCMDIIHIWNIINVVWICEYMDNQVIRAICARFLPSCILLPQKLQHSQASGP